ncbi:MAG: FtsL-like putative cell division protein [Chitinophagales bacterium]
MEDFKTKIEETTEVLVDGAKKTVRFDDKNWFNNLPLVFLIAAIGVLHVANNHLAEQKVREINEIEQEIKKMRWTYMTAKSELMYKSKQSEVVEMVEHLGLEELTSPAFKIEEIEE